MRVAVTCFFFHLMDDVRQQLLEKYPDCKIKDSIPPIRGDELIEFCQGCEAALIGMDPFDEYVVSNLPDLKVIAMTTAGVDHVDPAALNRHGVRLGWFAGVNRVAVAEMTISQMIDIIRNLQSYSVATHQGDWPTRRVGSHLQGKTVGIHGCGNVGQEVARRLTSFGVKLLACDREDYTGFYAECGIESVGPEELWSRSDIVSIHLPLNSTTRGLYTADVLDQFKPGAYLINLARGGIVDEPALYERLEDGRIAGAAFDVFAVEPAHDNRLFRLPNFIGTPHCGSGATEAHTAMALSGIRGLTENSLPVPGKYPFD